MNKYSAYTNLYAYLMQISDNIQNNNIQHDNIQHDNIQYDTKYKNTKQIQYILSIILQNASQINLTQGQIKLVFCFIDKVKPVLSDNQKCLQIVLSELLVDYTNSQLEVINRLLLPENNMINELDIPHNIAINNIIYIPDNISNMTLQDQNNYILIESCKFIENSQNLIENKNLVYQLVCNWFE